jgi:methionyl-tRNA formyltransferase
MRGSLFKGPAHILRHLSCSASRRFYSQAATKPLRILFCGSNDISSASLHALCEEQKRNPSSIASIDVLCRPGKPYGRGLKKIRDVPLKATAQRLGLRTHMQDTFTGWELPKVDGEAINLIIAVSFGLFVPRRILNSTEYVGLNIHPSLLPDLRGPSPIHYAVLKGYTQTGVTLQSLSPKSFDDGRILLQTPIDIPNPEQITHGALQDILTPISADLLVRGLREKVYLPESPSVEPILSPGKILTHAPKIKSEDMRLLSKMTAKEIVRIERALSKVWVTTKLRDDSRKRVVLDGLEAVPMPKEMSDFFNTH